MARLPARRSQPSGSHANPRSSSVPERKRARIVEFNSGHLKPFDYGFRREMVVRGTVPGQDGGRIMSDIYYYTPTGTKLRSMPEVSAYLAKNRKLPLTADNFNFKRATIHQPPHEVVRNAGPRHSGKFKSARVTRQSAPAALEPASPVPASPAAVPALPASAVEHAKSLCAATLSGRRKARKPLCGCCESRHEWHQQVHKDAPGHHHLHRAASKKWPGHGVPQAYRRAPKPTVVPSGRRSQPPVAQNTTYAKVPADESAAHTEDTKGGEPEESSVAYESPRKSVSPSKLQQVTEECAVQPSVRHAVVLVNDILKPEVGEKAASDADRVLATPKACADSWQNATARELYRVLTRWQNASEQAAATATEDDLLGDPVIIKEGTEPLGASPALDPEGSSVLSSQSKPAAVSREPCTARCSRATGETPELQCKRCLCFFHPICIGLSHLATTKGRFVCKQETVVNGGPSSLYVGSSSCEPVTKVESVPQAFIATDKSDAFHSVSPLPGCPFVISSSYSLAGKEVSERDSSSPAECDGKEQAPGASMDQAYVVVTKDRCSGNGSDTSDLKMAYEIGHIWPATSHMGSESEDGSAHVSTKATSVRVEQKEPSDKFPSGNSGSVCEVLRNKRRHHFVTLPEPPGISLWLSSGGRLTCVHDRQDSIGANTVEPDHSVSGSVVLFNSVPDSASSMRGFTDMFTVLTEIFKWLPTPTLCKTAQVSRAWRKLSAMSDSWKRVNFSHFHVHDWDACVKMLRDMRTEELVLERDSLEPVLCRITMLDTVKHVALEVNPLQLARVARAFPHLHSISALISRRGCSLRPPTTAVFVLDRGRRERRQCVCTRMLFITLAKNTRSRPASYKTSTSTAEPRHPASLGGLSELLCVAGLERLELRGAHGLAILPLTMSPNCLAQRCHQLRALSLVTVQNMTPEVVFLISLLHGLEELHLGECIKWSETSFLNISKLKKLRRLTLEHGEDKSGFRSMLLRLSNLERLELKQWTLRNSLADTLPHMTLLRHLLLCPVNGDLASKTNRNVLRSCLAAGATLKQITWVVSCKSSTSPQGVFDLNLAFEPGNLCDCPSIIAASNPADVPVSTPGGSLRNADISPEAQEVASGHLQCCAFAKKFRHMWKPSLHLAWYMTVRQVCQGLKRCLGPHTAVCFCAQVEQ
ncbi:uncharacterized protein LOC144132256 isoform X12 [Amblyomma americanum]